MSPGAPGSSAESEVTAVQAEELGELLPLVRQYCDFYSSQPTDEALLAISRALLADPEREGIQFLARAGGAEREPIGFATLYWSWETNAGGQIGVMNDLFVAPEHRGRGHAEALIAACADAGRRHGAVELIWQTGLDNHRAQAVYDRVGAHRTHWLDYTLELHPPLGG